MTLTLTDLFCGAGGSSSGAEQVPGVVVRMAANHWRLAVQTHQQNLPHAEHDIADISQVNPRRYPRTDLLWASPECTNHTPAKGRRRAVDAQPDLFGEVLPDEAADRSRATMWDVLRFAEVHRYRGIVVENVVQVRDWVLWPSWVMGLANLGYAMEVVYLNSMFAQAAGEPAPQSRDRLYVVAWRSGERRPDLGRWARPPATCHGCGRTASAVQAWKRGDRPWGRYRAQYVWRCPSCRAEVFPAILPAATAIDWSLPGQRIGERARPLAEKTVARIVAGLRRYARPIQVETANGYATGAYVRPWPLDAEPFRTLVGSESKGVACPPLLVPSGGTWNEAAASVEEPFRTRTSRETEGLVRPWPAQALVVRNNTARGDPGQMATPVDEPLRTLTGAGNQSLVRWDHLMYGYDSGQLRPVAAPLPTQTTVEGDALVGPARSAADRPAADLDVAACTFRMLEPDEIRAAMAFGAGYAVLGNRRERVRQFGNAVTPCAARDLISALSEAILGEVAA